MAYQALYRVWRSQRFSDVVGQQAVTQTLKNAIIQKKTSHAYLFTGPRGTGKTSAAKIFAKAINCPNNQEGEPCNECEICTAITAGRLNDVIEIDAASNNGVEEIREIRDKAKYAPTQAHYKIYIIDEVHMLSTGAFNALLKTLEEPPQNVIFILATTEPHKIPLTIISRTQRFDFKRISTQDIVGHLQYIMQQIDLPVEEQALYVIARAAEGGMRDALSILDQAISFSDETLTLQDAMQVTGSLTYEMMDQYLQNCRTGATEAALEAAEAIFAEGKEASRFLEDLLLYCRDLLMYQKAPKLLAEKSGTLTEAFKDLSQTLTADQIYQMIQILSETQRDVRLTNHATIYVEVATVKLAQLAEQPRMVTTNIQAEGVPATTISEQIPELQQLQAQIQQLETELQQLKQGQKATVATPAKPKASVPTRSTFKVPTERVFQVLNEATRDHLQQMRQVWDDLLQMMTVTQRAMLKASEPIAAGPNGVVIAFEYEIVCTRASEDQDLQLAVGNALSRLLNYSPNLICITKESWPKIRQSFVQQNNSPTMDSPTNDSSATANTTNISDLAVAESAAEPVAEPATNEVVDEAIALFGTDLVEVVND